MSNRSIARVILVAIAIVAVLYFLYLIRNVLWLLFIAVFLAIALGPLVESINRHGVPRSLSIVLVYLGLQRAFNRGLLAGAVKG